ncbi:MAG: endonuclease III [Candidatus Wallacebacter cryptica]|jgi:endonuclease-3|nr:endonuclease III [Bacillota bacterium]
MLEQAAVDEILEILAQLYPNPTTELEHETPFQLLIATILSAQCTDQRVNIITRKLFADHPTVESLEQLSIQEIESYIRTAGLWQTKAKNIKRTCEILIDNYNGEVPRTREELMKLPGVGRKTANVVLANAFNVPAFPVDTHVHRVANRLGLAASSNPNQTEEQLTALIPEEYWKDAHHWLILHGRRVCSARKPNCEECPLAHLCQTAFTHQ